MTQERLRELLRERVADKQVPDLSALSWGRARTLRPAAPPGAWPAWSGSRCSCPAGSPP